MFDFLKRFFFNRASRPIARLENGDERALLREIAAAENMDVFDGYVEHGYSLSNVKNADQCPRCQAPTRQQYATFIYNNQISPRMLVAPAGFFCTKCKTVIVDEKILRKAATPGFDYLGTIGVTYDDNRPPDIFSTWNGKPFDFFLGEAVKMFSSGDAYSPQRWEKIKRKKQMAKASRKRNRRN